MMSEISIDLLAPKKYKSKELAALLDAIRTKKMTGTLTLEIQPNIGQNTWSRVILWDQGEITYGGNEVPNYRDLASKLIRKVKPELLEPSLEFIGQHLSQPNLLRQMLQMLVQSRILSWEQIENFVNTQVAIVLEQSLPFGGNYIFNPQINVDLGYGDVPHGLNWHHLMLTVNSRQQYWATLSPLIPSLDSIPRLLDPHLRQVYDPMIRQHLQKLVNGENSLIEICQKLDKDPLAVARSYHQWSQMGWISFSPIPISSKPIRKSKVLSVDDSPIIQTMIKKALGEEYDLLLANDAVNALHILVRHQVDLMLLDVTMPGIDGLELCQTVRNMSRFTNLPIIMLTAKDKSYDRILGQMVGSTEYLTKPFDDQMLKNIVGKYLKIGHSRQEITN
jgi:twitching motility two-component system response regulator PilG